MEEDIFVRYWENLLARTTGPLNLRFLLQPTMSLIFAIIAGFKDAKNGTVPYLWRFFFSEEERKHVAKEGWQDFGKIVVIGTVLDVLYQLIFIFKMKTQSYFYPLESITVVIFLAIVPYLLFRGPVSRVVRWLIKKRGNGKS